MFIKHIHDGDSSGLIFVTDGSLVEETAIFMGTLTEFVRYVKDELKKKIL